MPLTTAIKTHQDYKLSPVESLGEIPVHWDAMRLGNIGRFSKGSGGSKQDEVSDGIPCIRYGDLYASYDHHIEFSRSFVTEASAFEYTPIRSGDVLFAGSGETIEEIGKSAVNLIEGPVCCGGDVILWRPSIAIDARFCGYALDCYYSQFQKSCMGKGITIMHIYSKALKYLYIGLPPLSEQASIVRYLDHVSRRLRRYVRAKERLIGLLEEEKQAIINQAVTRGLDPSVRLKASGVEWLGDVPEHWEVRRLKRVLHRLIDCEHKTAPAVSTSSYRVVRTSAVRGGSLSIAGTYCTSERAFAVWTRRGNLEPGDVIFTREAPAGEACVVPKNLNLCLGQRTVLMKVDRNAYDPHFLVHMLYAGPPHDEIELASRGSTVPHFNVEDIGVLPVLTPPVPEQTAIVRYLDRETTDIDAAITRARRQVELVQEYRTRLIADVVTGKLDVREAVAGLADEGGAMAAGQPAGGWSGRGPA